jgi:hypothetical protein
MWQHRSNHSFDEPLILLWEELGWTS